MPKVGDVRIVKSDALNYAVQEYTETAIADKLLADLDRYDEEAHTEYMANLALESEVTE